MFRRPSFGPPFVTKTVTIPRHNSCFRALIRSKTLASQLQRGIKTDAKKETRPADSSERVNVPNKTWIYAIMWCQINDA